MSKVGKIKLVIAGNHRQYEHWLWFHKQLKGYEVSRYISSIDKLYGYHPDNSEIVLEGTYWENPVYNNDRFDFLTKGFVIISPPKGLLKHLKRKWHEKKQSENTH